MEYHIFSGTSPSLEGVFLKKMTKRQRLPAAGQQVALRLTQNAKMATGHSVQGQLSFCPALQIGNRHPPGSQHPPDLMVFSLANCHQALSRSQRFQLGRKAHRPVSQHQSPGKGFHIPFCPLPLVAGIVHLGHPVSWGNQPVSQLAIVCKQQEPLRILVQTPHRR